MESRDDKQETKSDLMHHPEHMCSLRVNSCGKVQKAQIQGARPGDETKVSSKAPDICTPFSIGV